LFCSDLESSVLLLIMHESGVSFMFFRSI
jgi:hypothetical protein